MGGVAARNDIHAYRPDALREICRMQPSTSRARAYPFLLADAKRKREFGVTRGDEVKFEDMKKRIGIIIKEEKHDGDFQVHMEADVQVESGEEIELDI